MSKDTTFEIGETTIVYLQCDRCYAEYRLHQIIVSEDCDDHTSHQGNDLVIKVAPISHSIYTEPL